MKVNGYHSLILCHNRVLLEKRHLEISFQPDIFQKLKQTELGFGYFLPNSFFNVNITSTSTTTELIAFKWWV
jgi:hypothetical protein